MEPHCAGCLGQEIRRAWRWGLFRARSAGASYKVKRSGRPSLGSMTMPAQRRGPRHSYEAQGNSAARFVARSVCVCGVRYPGSRAVVSHSPQVWDVSIFFLMFYNHENPGLMLRTIKYDIDFDYYDHTLSLLRLTLYLSTF